MKKIVLAVAAIALNAGAALSENPFVSQPEAVVARDRASLLSGQGAPKPVFFETINSGTACHEQASCVVPAVG